LGAELLEKTIEAGAVAWKRIKRKVFLTGQRRCKVGALFCRTEIPDKPEERFLMTPCTILLTLSLLLCGSNARHEQVFSRTFTSPEIQSSVRHHSVVNQRVTYKTYSNARYGFSIAYPLSVLLPQGESDNGDGQKFVSKDGSASLLAFGSNRLDRSLQDEFQAAQENRTVTYKILKSEWFVVSGTENGKIFYQKTLLRGDTFKTFIIEYDEGERATFDPITTRVARSFVG
jgi:hypothetical protein